MQSKTFYRAVVYGVLLIAALLFLAPMYVMLVTSFKDADQKAHGKPGGLPHIQLVCGASSCAPPES